MFFLIFILILIFVLFSIGIYNLSMCTRKKPSLSLLSKNNNPNNPNNNFLNENNLPFKPFVSSKSFKPFDTFKLSNPFDTFKSSNPFDPPIQTPQSNYLTISNKLKEQDKSNLSVSLSPIPTIQCSNLKTLSTCNNNGCNWFDSYCSAIYPSYL